MLESLPVCPLSGQSCKKSSCIDSVKRHHLPLCEVVANSIAETTALFAQNAIDEATTAEQLTAAFTTLQLSRQFSRSEGKRIANRGLTKAFESMLAPEERTLERMAHFRRSVLKR